MCYDITLSSTKMQSVIDEKDSSALTDSIADIGVAYWKASRHGRIASVDIFNSWAEVPICDTVFLKMNNNVHPPKGGTIYIDGGIFTM